MTVYFSIQEAYLISAWVASFLWGCFTVLYIYALSLMFSKRTKRSINVFLTTAITLLYILASAHASISLARLIEGFIVHAGDIGPGAYLINISEGLNEAKDLVYITSLWLGDSIVVWRCYMVWNKSWLVTALPILMVFGTALSGYGAIGHYFGLQESFIEETARWGDAMFIISMSTNIIVTTLTAGRIWWIARRAGTLRKYSTLLLLIVESGGIVTVVKVLEFALFNVAPGDGNGLNAMYIPFDAIPQITGIVPTLILVVVLKEMTFNDQVSVYTSGPSNYLKPQTIHSSTARVDQTNSDLNVIPLQAMKFSTPLESNDSSV